MHGVRSQPVREQIQGEVSPRNVMKDPEGVLEIQDEWKLKRVVREEQWAAMKERQERRGSGGGRGKSCGSGECGGSDSSHSHGRGAAEVTIVKGEIAAAEM